MLGTTNRTLRIHDVSEVLTILARANRWTAYFALLARCAPEEPKACDARKRQAIRVIDVGGER